MIYEGSGPLAYPPNASNGVSKFVTAVVPCLRALLQSCEKQVQANRQAFRIRATAPSDHDVLKEAMRQHCNDVRHASAAALQWDGQKWSHDFATAVRARARHARNNHAQDNDVLGFVEHHVDNRCHQSWNDGFTSFPFLGSPQNLDH